MRRLFPIVIAVCALGTGAATAVAVPRDVEPTTSDAVNRAAAAAGPGRPAWLERRAMSTGFQLAPKRPNGARPRGADPRLALIPDLSGVDYAGWEAYAKRMSTERTVARSTPRGVAPFGYDEDEPAGVSGSNDRRANAEEIAAFGTSPGDEPAVRISGRLSPPRVPARRITTREDQGSIPDATDTRIPRRGNTVVVRSRIGDGPHGRARSGRGDFDFFQVRARPGGSIFASTVGSDERFDTILAVYDADGTIVAADDDSGSGLSSELNYDVVTGGNYYVMVSGFLSLPRNPFRSGSGSGAESQGRYRLKVSTEPGDRDMYAVQLEAGDVLGGTVEGAASDLAVHDTTGGARVASTFDATYIYPMDSPLPGGGTATFAYVAEEAGWYTVSTRRGKGRYSIDLEAYRPGETVGGPRTQRLFLDFDGARVNTGVFWGAGVSQLSPLSAFLGRWKVPGDSLDAVIDRVVATVRENVEHDLRERGLNDDVQVEVLNSRDHPDPFGQPGVSRVVVGGTIEQSGVPTIGIAQSIDPGNYEREETALLLLDILSGSRREWGDASLNYYLRGRSDRVRFVGSAIGNVASHEVGHLIGNFHVDQFNDVLNLMDQGGNFPLLYGVGPDGVGGTADDPDVDFGEDHYSPEEGFTGVEDTLNTSTWAFSDE